MNLYYFDFEDTGGRLESKALQKKYSHALLRRVIYTETGLDSDKLARCFGPYGKPSFANCERCFNCSNTRGLVVVATGECEVGVDCEHIKEYRQRTAQAVCSEEELASICENSDFFGLWTFKEAFVKMLGEGLRHSLKTVTQVSVRTNFPQLSMIQTTVGGAALCSVENRVHFSADAVINLYRVDLLS